MKLPRLIVTDILQKEEKKGKKEKKDKTCNFCWHICFRRSTLFFQLHKPPHSYYLFNVFGSALHNYLPRILDGEGDREGRSYTSFGSHIHHHIQTSINAPICTNNSTHISKFDRIFSLSNNNLCLFLRKPNDSVGSYMPCFRCSILSFAILSWWIRFCHMYLKEISICEKVCTQDLKKCN